MCLSRERDTSISSNNTSSSRDWSVWPLHSCWLLLHFIRHKLNRALIFLFATPLSVYLFFSVFMVLLNDALHVHLWPLQCISMAFQYLLWVQLWKMLKAHKHVFKGCIGYYGNGVEFERNQCTLMVLNTHKDTNSFWTKCSTKWKHFIISLYNSCQYFVA